jgi:AmmeMemoRadiSam system protein A
VLLALARQTIEDALAAGGRRPAFAPDVCSGGDPALTESGAAFVTLRSASGALLGCIGSLTATQSLVADVAQHAYDAAFRDPRFAPMSRHRAQDMVIDVCVLSPTRPLACSGYDNLLDRLPVGSGLVVEAGRHRATFLPTVWEQLPTPPEFVAALWRKAGLTERQWPPDTRIEVYDCEEFAEQ